MAANVSNAETFPCSECDQMFDLSSKTLPCLHSFCRSCIEMILEENGPCPQCQEPVTGDDLRLSPFLEKSLRRRQLQSTEWRCVRCFEENGRESTVQIWCQECEKLLCQTCERFHSGHETKDLMGMSRGEAVKVITTDGCGRHRQSKDAFCQRCNTYLCKLCYQDHVIASPQCPPRPLSVRKEASNEKIRSPTLERQLRQFEINIRETYALTSRSIDQLSTDCESECSKLFLDFKAFVEEARLKLAALCDNMNVMTSELQTKWRHSLKEKKNLLKKVKVWHHTLEHLSRDDADDEDVVTGLKLVRAELSARLHQSFAPQEKGRWLVTFLKWCHDSLESLKKEIIVWETEISRHLQLESECRLQGSNLLNIYSIVAVDEDNRVFVGDFESRSILEFSDSGELVGQCPLKEGGKEFCPWDMCRLSEDILVVCGLEQIIAGFFFFLFFFLSFLFNFRLSLFSLLLFFFFSLFFFHASKHYLCFFSFSSWIGNVIFHPPSLSLFHTTFPSLSSSPFLPLQYIPSLMKYISQSVFLSSSLSIIYLSFYLSVILSCYLKEKGNYFHITSIYQSIYLSIYQSIYLIDHNSLIFKRIGETFYLLTLSYNLTFSLIL
ncbi:unnamed protein product [Acanthosepion pharaonis]|uniref:Uncharacterized protein n=1 Tax=Acanthosepion pharaonis TaxID=158019 RepID=A0A812E1N2_ACAPH|nr:unnamed protein product [Sepia pharaonis]